MHQAVISGLTNAYLGLPGMISTDDIQDIPGASFCGFWALTDSTQAKFL